MEKAAETNEQILYHSHDLELRMFIRNTKINRPKEWPELDLAYLEKEYDSLSVYELKMVMNTCKTTEIAFTAIKKYRKACEDFREFFRQMAHEEAVEHYRRSKYKDIEDDIEEEYY